MLIFTLILINTLSPKLFVYSEEINNELPIILSTNLSTDTVAYHGNTVPSYLEVAVNTNKLTTGYIDVIGETTSSKIILTNGQYSTRHGAIWVPWDEVTDSPLPEGTYHLKLTINDKDGNSINNVSLGSINVEKEINPQPLIINVSANPSSITPKYAHSGAITSISFKVNHFLSMVPIIKKNGKEYGYGAIGGYKPGEYTWEWTGRDQKGLLVPEGEYEIVFRYTEMGYSNSKNVEK